MAIRLLELATEPFVVVEDEGRLIGRIHLPQPVQTALKASRLILLEDSLDNRVTRILNEYIVAGWHDYHALYGDAALPLFSDYLLGAIDAIKKRLGGDLHQSIREIMTNAIEKQVHGDAADHRIWIELLLTQYYDPMYEYQLSRKRERIAYEGDFETLKQNVDNERRQHG